MVFGLVGLMCGCELGTTALSESDISDDYNEDVKKSLRKLIATGNCEGCPLMGVGISGKDLNHKDLRNANLTGADLRNANLTGADLTEVDLTGAYLRYANLTGANLTGADLRNANLFKVNLNKANLSGADLTGAKIKNIRNLDSAIKCKTIFSWGEDNSGCK